MSRLFDYDSDCDSGLKTNNEYAKNYDNWRKKEEINKLKAKYGDETLDNGDEGSSSSSDDDEEGVELTQQVEKDFFKTLSYLKNKDPRIYDENTKFFEEPSTSGKKLTKKQKSMTLKDYERKMLLETNGEFPEDEEEEDIPRSNSPTYIEQQREAIQSLKNIMVEEDGSEGMLKRREQSSNEIPEEEDCKEWLAGHISEISDKKAEVELKPLKDYWSNPKLDAGEKFLRDFILNKRFLSKENEDYIPTYESMIHDSDKDLSEDELQIEKQEEFEHKYNFRFEEPDQDFIKRYPRTMEQSLRKTDDKRKVKRAETKDRKIKEKEEKKVELKQLQDLKRKEIEEKIQRLKEITGNDQLGFKDEDLDADFDPEEHDKRMHDLFNQDFYEGDEEDQKPEFPEIDEFLELENWEKWNGEKHSDEEEPSGPHCEDDNFNMDCDYDPNAVQNELIENSKGTKKRKRKSVFAKALQKPKPAFDPNDKTYEEYLDEYYKLDCEDIVAGIPCRFKYRKVVPNSFGLTTEEILGAKDRELNKWCSLKKAVQYRPEHIEKYDQIAFEKKSQNIDLKRRVLPSLFEEQEDDDNKKTKNKAQNRNLQHAQSNENGTKKNMKNSQKEQPTEEKKETVEETVTKPKKKKNKPTQDTVIKENEPQLKKEDEKKPKNKKKKSNNNSTIEVEVPNVETNPEIKADTSEKKNKKKRKHTETNDAADKTTEPKKKKFKKNANKKNPTEKAQISDARLSAYGINPKKYKNKLKYANK